MEKKMTLNELNQVKLEKKVLIKAMVLPKKLKKETNMIVKKSNVVIGIEFI